MNLRDELFNGHHDRALDLYDKWTRDTAIGATSGQIDGLTESLRIVTEERDAFLHALRQIDQLVRPGEGFYSWQRVWQTVARIVLDMPEDSSMEDLRLALALRDNPEGGL